MVTSIVDSNSKVRWDVVKAWFKPRYHVYKTEREFNMTTRWRDKTRQYYATFADRNDALLFCEIKQWQTNEAAGIEQHPLMRDRGVPNG